MCIQKSFQGRVTLNSLSDKIIESFGSVGDLLAITERLNFKLIHGTLQSKSRSFDP